jgi:hypothetical protein
MEELLDLEVIANLWLNGEIAFLVPVIPGTHLDLIGQAPAATIADILRIDDG